STVLDFRRFEEGGRGAVEVIRRGAVSDEQIEQALAGQFHFDPDTYLEMIRDDLPLYEELQAEVVAASVAYLAGSGGGAVRAVLELGTGTGETARRLLERDRQLVLVGIDESESMLVAARRALAPWADRVTLRAARLQDPLPAGRFQLVLSALCVHHLDAAEKADLFSRVHAALVPGG